MGEVETEPYGKDTDPYLVLGIPSDASVEQVRRAYRSLALRHHPDSNPGDPSAGERFREVRKAYEILSDRTGKASGNVANPVQDDDMTRVLERLRASLVSTLYGSVREGCHTVEISLGKSCFRGPVGQTEHRDRKTSPTSGFVRPVPPEPPKAPRKCR